MPDVDEFVSADKREAVKLLNMASDIFKHKYESKYYKLAKEHMGRVKDVLDPESDKAEIRVEIDALEAKEKEAKKTFERAAKEFGDKLKTYSLPTVLQHASPDNFYSNLGIALVQHVEKEVDHDDPDIREQEIKDNYEKLTGQLYKPEFRFERGERFSVSERDKFAKLAIDVKHKDLQDAWDYIHYGKNPDGAREKIMTIVKKLKGPKHADTARILKQLADKDQTTDPELARALFVTVKVKSDIQAREHIGLKNPQDVSRIVPDGYHHYRDTLKAFLTLNNAEKLSPFRPTSWYKGRKIIDKIPKKYVNASAHLKQRRLV